jgi:hypothetical protein
VSRVNLSIGALLVSPILHAGLQLDHDPVVVEESNNTTLISRGQDLRADFFQARNLDQTVGP